MSRYGVEGDPRLSWKELVAFKRTFSDPVPKRRQQAFAEQGIDCFHDTHISAAPDTILAGNRELKARHILIATGAKPAPLGFRDEEYLTTSDAFMELESLAQHIIMVGRGCIAVQFAHIASRTGTKVTVLERAKRLLTRFDPELVGRLMNKFSELGISLHLETTVNAIERDGNRYRVHVQHARDTTTFESDVVVHAGGRIPVIGGLDLAAGNVAVEPGACSSTSTSKASPIPSSMQPAMPPPRDCR